MPYMNARAKTMIRVMVRIDWMAGYIYGKDIGTLISRIRFSFKTVFVTFMNDKP
jgi:hypothetical protein